MPNSKPITKAVITAAGRGTRFLPITKVIPKEMLPIGNKPTVHYLLEECKNSGVEQVCIVIREWGSLTEQYFAEDKELKQYLVEKDKKDLVDEVDRPGIGLQVSFVKQDPALPYGNGAPVLSAKSFIGDDDFYFMQGDDLFTYHTDTPLVELQNAWQSDGSLGAVLGAVTRSEEDIAGKLGSIVTEGENQNGFYYMTDMVEKPEIDKVPSTLATVGRVLLHADIISYLQDQSERLLREEEDSTREFYIWDAILAMRDRYKLAAKALSGEWLTTGTPEQMWEAQVKLNNWLSQ
jgi:UTP--glucose-1-phosphate uridylyltransferase